MYLQNGKCKQLVVAILYDNTDNVRFLKIHEIEEC